MTSPKSIRSLPEACDYMLAQLRQHPERDAIGAWEAAAAGRHRPYPVIALNHLAVPTDVIPPPDDLVLPKVQTPATPEGDLAREVIGMLEPLRMLNPIAPVFGLGKGPGTLVTAFGIPLDPETVNAPAFTKTIAQVLADPPPDPATAGLMPEMHARIERIKSCTPEAFRIGLPDMQGPFNLAHSTVGMEALMAPCGGDEASFRALMDRITTFWLAARRNLTTWIGNARLAPENRLGKICECSVNLVSPDFYREWILPHDQRIASTFGQLHIHPCSGPHVFHVTLQNLPVVITEAGFIDRTAAGAITVDDALAAIRDQPILLHIGQELPEGREYEFVRADFDRYAANPRLLFAYTGMHWRRKDRPLIRDTHRRLDAYWAQRYR